MNNLIKYSLVFILSLGFVYPEIKLTIPLITPEEVNNRENFSLIIGIMAEFQEEINDEASTSGNGLFLQSLEDNLNYINYDNISRCNPINHMVLDPPPHNTAYFNSQLIAVQNYYSKVYGEQQFDVHMIDSVFTVTKEMKEYAYSNLAITDLYVESVELAKNQVEEYFNINPQYNIANTLIVVFHAGLGQDFAAPLFDPTPYDIHSAYIDNNMIIEHDNQLGNDDFYAYSFNEGILLPETLNMIYYDVVEDWYSPSLTDVDELENSYCDIQFGMTGLFAYFLGYKFGFSPMHSTENITEVESQGFSVPTRIGQFGLMDIGMFNGRGIMPALPSSYTRDKLDIEDAIDITSSTLENQFESFDLSQRINNDEIYKLRISSNEYFLFENSNNEFYYSLCNRNYSLDELQNFFQTECNYLQDGEICDYNCDGIEDEENEYVFWLDIARDNNLLIINNETGVIEGLINDNYDLGMPGSGILMWHIDESLTSNNDRDNKMVHLEEADGIINIGLSEPFFGAGWIIDGWHNDYWFNGNEFYEQLNSGNNTVLVNETSIPNSNLNSNTPSYFEIEIASPISEDMTINISTVNDYFTITEIDTDIDRILGNDGYCMFYVNDNASSINDIKTYGSGDYCDLEYLSELDFDLSCSKDLNQFDNDDSILFHPSLFNGLCLVEEISYIENGNILSIDNPELPEGLFGYSDNFEIEEFTAAYSDGVVFPTRAHALGDIDQDGFDELIEFSAEDGDLYISNYNRSLLNGFPITLTCLYPLIADIIGDNHPEIICANPDAISIVSHEGNIEYSLPYNDYHLMGPFLLINNNKISYICGNKAITFNKIYNDDINDNIYWSNIYSTTYNYPIVQGPSVEYRMLLNNNISQESQFGIDVSRAYNYPNPFSGLTSFRYFVGTSQSVEIKIYDAAGFLVDTINDDELVANDYNEISWNANGYLPGLYFGALKSDANETKLIKILITE